MERGLGSSEAAGLLRKFGPNEIVDVGRGGAVAILLRQLRSNFVVLLLVVSSVAAFLVGKFATGFVILVIVALVVVLGFFQEFKSEQSVRALRRLIIPASTVIRDGKPKEVLHSEIVPGDVVVIRSGEKVPADCVVLEQRRLKVNESTLTGESREVVKFSARNGKVEDRHRLFMGTFAVSGRCVARVAHTGMNTRFGKIAYMISSSDKELPLRDKVNRVSLFVALVGFVVSVLTGLLVLSQQPVLDRDALVSVAVLVIAICVSAFPEGFPLVLTTTLSVGAHRMAQRNAIVNRLSVIETLGETTVICSDKTGTITTGEMTVSEVWAGVMFEVSGVGFDRRGEFSVGGRVINPLGRPVLSKLLSCAAICNDSELYENEDGVSFIVKGNATEAALLVLAAKAGLRRKELSGYLRDVVPFTSERKMMSVVWEEGNFSEVCVKGAVEVLLERCAFVETARGPVRMDHGRKRDILGVSRFMASRGLRTIALAYKKRHSGRDLESNLVFLGIAGIDDPPREGVRESLEVCRLAGIRVKLITGDNAETALSVAGQIGLEKGELLTGSMLDELSDDELKGIVGDVSVFARVRPEHKLRIVSALKANGEIVTMTGDGVNDAPALKEAHVGVAMGRNGTDVARSVADLTLRDDHFSTIVDAIREGRSILKNIRKFVSYQLSCNVAELSILFFGVLLAPWLGWPVPLLVAMQILFMNLVTSDLPAITLGLTPSSSDIMQQKPERNAPLVSRDLVAVMALFGALMFGFTIASFYLAYNVFSMGVDYSRTAALVTLVLVEIAAAFSFRSFRHGSINSWLLTHRLLVYASAASVLATLVVVYSGLSVYFDAVAIRPLDWVVSLVFCVVLVVFFDLLKALNNRLHILNL
ncbi:cation-transporting P-type ATPase [Candidatus Woesearchaeota archaeon]|nr:cation-transporting P-type ATPase [Candidatus Woesearchaeota archaeon]